MKAFNFKTNLDQLRCCSVLGLKLLLLAVTFSTLAATDPLSTWTLRTPLPSAETLESVQFANERFIAVGGAGTVRTSRDGISWDHQVLPSGVSYKTVLSGNGIYLALSSSGTNALSADGATWTENRAAKVLGEHAAFGNGVFVVGQLSGMYWSTNGISWVRAITDYASGLRFVNGEFVMFSPYPDGIYSQVWRSSDGKRWNLVSTPRAMLIDIAFGAGKYLAITHTRELFESVDLRVWTPTSLPKDANSYAAQIEYLTGRFIIIGQGLTVSTDGGLTWVIRENPSALSSIAFGNGRFVATGAGGNILISNDGLDWEPAEPEFYRGSTWKFLSFNGGVLALNGQVGELIFSKDATDWKKTGAINQSNGHWTDYWYAIAADSSRAIAIHNTASPIETSFWSSENGQQWQKTYSTTNFLYHIIHTGREFIAVGDHFATSTSRSSGLILTSSNGEHWTSQIITNFAYVNSAAYLNGTYLAAGENGVVVSTNGIEWTFTRTVSLGKIIASPSGFYGIRGTGVYRSTNGVAWAQVYTAPAGLYNIANEQDVILTFGGQNASTGSTEVYYSRNAGPWRKARVPTGDYLANIISFRGTFLLAASGGGIWQSGQVFPFLSADRDGSLNISASPGQEYGLEMSSGIGAAWRPAGDHTGSQRIDAASKTSNSFFRAILK